MTIVQHTLQHPDMSAYASEQVTVALVGDGITSSGAVQIIQTSWALTGTDGSIQFDLADTETMSPDGCYYVWRNPDGSSKAIRVPQTGGPYNMTDLVFVPPGSPDLEVITLTKADALSAIGDFVQRLQPITTGGMMPGTSSVVLATNAGKSAWQLRKGSPSAAHDYVTMQFATDTNWLTFNIDLTLFNGTTSTGNVVLRLDTRAVGTDTAAAWTAGNNVTVPAPAQNHTSPPTRLATNVPVNPTSDTEFRIIRLDDDAADTLTIVIGLHRLDVTKAS